MDAKKQGKHVEDLSTAALGRRYLTPGDVKQDKGDDKGTTSRRSPERVRMHQAAMAIVERFRQHGDARVATQMIDSIEKQEDKDALRAWFLCFGGMVGDKKTGGFRKNRASAPDLKGGAAKPYWKFKPPAPRRPFDLDVEGKPHQGIPVRPEAERPAKHRIHTRTLHSGHRY